MVEIIPSILTESDEEFVRQVHVLERAGVSRVHLDIADGIFVPRRTIVGHEQLRRLTTNLLFDVHLMVAHPETYCAAWSTVANAARFLIHVETTDAFALLREHLGGTGRSLGAAINPGTRTDRLDNVIDLVDMVQFMAVHPGAQGRQFLPEVLERVSAFHLEHPTVPIMIDGGITPITASACVHAGATHLVSGSFVVRATDAGRALKELETAASRA